MIRSIKKRVYKIFKGCHYPFPIDLGGCFLNRFTKDRAYFIQGLYTFDSSARYDIGAEDQSDVNKLVGLSFGLHHNNSIRIGWRYRDGFIELVYYAYRNGKRYRTKDDVIGRYELPENGSVSIYISGIYNSFFYSPDIEQFVVSASRFRIDELTSELIEDEKNFKSFDYPFPGNSWSYGLGLYFGGNKTAPHTIKVKREYFHCGISRREKLN